MNVNPSDTDVRQGYALAETIAVQTVNPGSSTSPAQTTPVTPSTNTTEASATTASQQTSETDERSKTIAASADKTAAKEAAQKLGAQLDDSDTGFKLRVLEDNSHTIQVEIVDKKSDKVLRKIPQDEMLKLSASMKEMTGVLLNKPA